MESTVRHTNEIEMACAFGALGYPGFSHLKGGKRKNTVDLLLSALSDNDLDIRLAEALPWVVYRFPNLDWNRLIKEAINGGVQNRLGFIVTLARQIAKSEGKIEIVRIFKEYESQLEAAKLTKGDDTLCHNSITQAERRWILNNRTEDARRWHLITDLRMEHLHYVTHRNTGTVEIVP